VPVAHEKEGKTSFAHVYDEPDPRPYFAALEPLDYRTPAHAEPIFRRLIAARRSSGRDGTVLDLCCSYGTNAALLNHDLTLDDLYARYTDERIALLDSDDLADEDRRLFAEHRRDDATRIGGCDVASRAVRYAERAGLLDAAFVEDLESAPPSPRLAAFGADVDLVTVTGGIGYIGATTLTRILGTASSSPPWIAAFALRMVPYGPIAAALAEHGLVTETLDATFPQRRFATADERDYVLQELEESGIGVAGEEEGSYLAVVHISRPVTDADPPLDELLSGTY
jgi:hypothetical protein